MCLGVLFWGISESALHFRHTWVSMPGAPQHCPQHTSRGHLSKQAASKQNCFAQSAQHSSLFACLTSRTSKKVILWGSCVCTRKPESPCVTIRTIKPNAVSSPNRLLRQSRALGQRGTLAGFVFQLPPGSSGPLQTSGLRATGKMAGLHSNLLKRTERQ